jgi:hypothetical protein
MTEEETLLQVEEALLQVQIAVKAVAQVRETLDVAEARLRAARALYVKVRPLTAAERDRLAARVEAGGPLCCKEGREWLIGQLPGVWAEELSAWAYDRLGCSEKRPERLLEYADKVRRLKLDELPG